jgi:chorismate mutase
MSALGTVGRATKDGAPSLRGMKFCGLAPAQEPRHRIMWMRLRTEQGKCMDIDGWRKKIDELDLQIVALISARAQAAQEIGKLKRSTSLPVYEPNRERVIFENVRAANHGPLPDIELTHIYERIIDVMRSLQKDELASQRKNGPGTTGETGKKP